MNYKQVIIVRKDLKMSAGKTSAQCSHASVEATFKSDPEKLKRWRNQGMKKVILKVNSKEELLEYKKNAERYKLKTALVVDAGKTVFKKQKEVEWVCRECGYVHKGKEAPPKCPSCDHPQAYYQVQCENY